MRIVSRQANPTRVQHFLQLAMSVIQLGQDKLMLEIMLCGAEDTDSVRNEFTAVVTAMGGDPWHYQSGHILFINSKTASWSRNSRATVQKADLCVFVIVEKYGDITWSVELREALDAGKPFLMFCLAKTYNKYVVLSRNLGDPSAIKDPQDRLLVAKLRELESDRQLSITPFEYGAFQDELRRGLAMMFEGALALQQVKNQRSALIAGLDGVGPVSTRDAFVLTEVATDELEEKTIRKLAILALSRHGGVGEEVILSLLGSSEQGVQRLVVRDLESLYATRPADADFFSSCVSLANDSDDVGISRRLIGSLISVDFVAAIEALAAIDLTDIGARRRLAGLLEEREPLILDPALARKTRDLLDRCVNPTIQSNWQLRAKEFMSRLDSILTS